MTEAQNSIAWTFDLQKLMAGVKSLTIEVNEKDFPFFFRFAFKKKKRMLSLRWDFFYMYIMWKYYFL